MTGVRRMVARHQRVARTDEQEVYRERFVSLQPTLDQTSYKLWGQLPGVDGSLIEQALTARAEQFPPPPDTKPWSRTQRHADALVAISQDSLNSNQTETKTSAPIVSIFIDAELAAATNGEAGATIDVGPGVGPLTLEQIL